MRECSRQGLTAKLLGTLDHDCLRWLKADWELWARDDQLPSDDKWTTWVLLGGRGAGKTRAGAEWVRRTALAQGDARIALIAETLGDARSIMVEGISGLLGVHSHGEHPKFEPSKKLLTWPNGAVAQLFSAEDPESLRGPQFSHAWADEVGKWPYAEQTWDMLQFRDATLVAPSTYELSVLLRGQAGTEAVMADPVSSGARFMLLDNAVSQVNMTADEIALEFNWKYGPISRDIAHSSIQETTRSFSGLGLRPFSPVHVQGRLSGVDVELSWVRRTRLGGDSWDTVEVSLGEDSEAYEVDILDGLNIKRTLTSIRPEVSYSGADQIADWGSPQSTYTITVYQLSAAYGRGQGRSAQINV